MARFLIDESSDARLADYLASLGHDVTLVARDYQPGIPDRAVLEIGRSEDRVIITDDRDFGDLIFRSKELHRGVIYFRLKTTVYSTREQRLSDVLGRYSDRLGEFLVVTDRRIRPR